MEALTITYFVVGSVNLAVILLIFTGFKKRRDIDTPTSGISFPPLSVIVAARNEAANLPELLAALSRQEYSGDFEVILVLDRCTDASLDLAQQAKQSFPELRILEIDELPAAWAGKKYALDQGIAQARHAQLVFTDADCRPPQTWLQAVGIAFSKKASLVLGGSPYLRQRGLLNACIRLETFWTFFQYAGLARLGFPWMAVGRNLGYSRSFFREQGGFSGISDRLSGDDDLLVNRAGKGEKVAVLSHKGSRVPSLPKETWKGWFRQKIRHISASPAYSWQSRTILGIIHGTHLLFYVSLILLIAWVPGTLPVWLFFASRWILLSLLLQFLQKDWEMDAVLRFFPLLDLFLLAYNLIIAPAGLLFKPDW